MQLGTKNKGKSGRPALLEEQIFDWILKDGSKSANEIIKNENPAYPETSEDKRRSRYFSVVRVLNRMAKKNLLKIIPNESDKRESHFELTEYGMRFAIEKRKIQSIADFSKMIFKHGYNHLGKDALSELFSFFENHVLLIDRKDILAHNAKQIIYNLKHIQDQKFYAESLPILEILGERKFISIDDLESIPNKRTDLVVDEILQRLRERGLVDLIHQPLDTMNELNQFHSSSLRLNVFGFITLLDKYRSDFIKEGWENKKTYSKCMKLINIHGFLLPSIFSKDNLTKLLNNLPLSNILFIISYMFFPKTWNNIPFLNFEELPLINDQNSMNNDAIIKIKREYRIILDEWERTMVRKKIHYPFISKGLRRLTPNLDPLYSDEILKFLFGFDENTCFRIQSFKMISRTEPVLLDGIVVKDADDHDPEFEQSKKEIVQDQKLKHYCNFLDSLIPAFSILEENLKKENKFDDAVFINFKNKLASVFDKNKHFLTNEKKLKDRLMRLYWNFRDFSEFTNIYDQIKDMQSFLYNMTESIDRYMDEKRDVKEHTITDIISFQFYTVMRYHHTNEWKLTVRDKEFSNWYEDHLKRINEFKKRDADLQKLNVIPDEFERQYFIETEPIPRL